MVDYSRIKEIAECSDIDIFIHLENKETSYDYKFEGYSKEMPNYYVIEKLLLKGKSYIIISVKSHLITNERLEKEINNIFKFTYLKINSLIIHTDEINDKRTLNLSLIPVDEIYIFEAKYSSDDFFSTNSYLTIDHWEIIGFNVKNGNYPIYFKNN